LHPRFPIKLSGVRSILILPVPLSLAYILKVLFPTLVLVGGYQKQNPALIVTRNKVSDIGFSIGELALKTFG